jgi:hypothetical protein
VLLAEVQKQLSGYRQGLPGNRQLISQIISSDQVASGQPEVFPA